MEGEAKKRILLFYGTPRFSQRGKKLETRGREKPRRTEAIHIPIFPAEGWGIKKESSKNIKVQTGHREQNNGERKKGNLLSPDFFWRKRGGEVNNPSATSGCSAAVRRGGKKKTGGASAAARTHDRWSLNEQG